MQAGESHPLDFLEAIHKAGIKYLLVGRRAIIAYGGPMQTMDYDFYVSNERDNIKKLLAVAETFDLYPSISEDEILKTFKFKLENDVSIDILCFKKFSAKDGKVISFSELYDRKTTLKGESGLEVYVPCVDDLIALKELRNSPKDREDIKYLKAIKKHFKEAE